MKKLLSLFILLPLCHLYAGQPQFDLYLTDGNIIHSILLSRQAGDSLYYSRFESPGQVHLNAVKKLVKLGESKFWQGAVYGFAGGAIIGALIGRASYKRPTGDFIIDFGPGLPTAGGAFVGGSAGFIMGGLIGSARKNSVKVYDFSGFPLDKKRMTIKAILNRQV